MIFVAPQAGSPCPSWLESRRSRCFSFLAPSHKPSSRSSQAIPIPIPRPPEQGLLLLLLLLLMKLLRLWLLHGSHPTLRQRRHLHLRLRRSLLLLLRLRLLQCLLQRLLQRLCFLCSISPIFSAPRSLHVPSADRRSAILRFLRRGAAPRHRRALPHRPRRHARQQQRHSHTSALHRQTRRPRPRAGESGPRH